MYVCMYLYKYEWITYMRRYFFITPSKDTIITYVRGNLINLTVCVFDLISS